MGTRSGSVEMEAAETEAAEMEAAGEEYGTAAGGAGGEDGILGPGE